MKVTNGKDVARLLVDEYLNCHPTGHKKFMESMAKEQQEIKDNYTYLGFAWLKGLSEVRYYDLRNEASKLMADDLCLHVKEQPERVRLVYEGAEEMEINPSDEEQMAKMFTCYLLAGSMDGYGEFVDYALDTHRTLQQNLTRFFVEWFAKAEKGSAFLKQAKMVYSRYSLPYIPAADATKQRPKLLKQQDISGATGKEQQQLQYLNQKFRPENALHAIRVKPEM